MDALNAQTDAHTQTNIVLFESNAKLTVTMRGNSGTRYIRLPARAKNLTKGTYYVIVKSPRVETPVQAQHIEEEKVTKADDAFVQDVGTVMDFFMDCLDEKEWGKRFNDLADTKGVGPIISRIQKVLEKVG